MERNPVQAALQWIIGAIPAALAMLNNKDLAQGAPPAAPAGYAA